MAGIVFKRIRRRPWLSLTGLVLACALCFALCFLVRYRDGQQQELETMRDSFSVQGIITNARGTKADHLRLHKRYMEYVQDEEKGIGAYIQDLCLTKELYLDWEPWKGLAIGVNSPRAAKALDPEQGGEYYSTEADFFESCENWCLVPRSLWETYGGRRVSMQMDNPYKKTHNSMSDLYTEKSFDLTVVGWYKGEESILYLPFRAALELGRSLTDTVSVDSVSFRLKDNAQVDLIREISAKTFVQPDPSRIDPNPGLSILDRQYKAALAEMEQNVAQTERLLPLSAALSLAVGFFMGFLSVRGETRNYALMRTLGLGKGRLACQALLEQLLLPALGALLVGLIMQQALPAFVYFACHALGCMLAVIKPALAKPTKLLRDS